MTIIELLVAIAVLGVILSLLAAFFSSQARTSGTVQARNEVEVKARAAAEVVAQDLQMAGSRIVVDRSGAQPVAVYVDELLVHCSPLKGSVDYCVESDGSSATVFYATSLRLGMGPCRRVDYSLGEEGVLLRSEVPCASDASTDNSDLQPFAENITGFAIQFLCEDGGTSVANPADCYTAGTFPVEATVSVTGTSQNTRENRQATVTLTTALPNLRPVAITEPPAQGG